MTAAGERKRTMIGAATIPALPAHIKLRHDPGRGRWHVLAPERVFEPDGIAIEVLKRIDGIKSVETIVGELAKEYQAPASEILADVITMLQDLADKGVVKG